MVFRRSTQRLRIFGIGTKDSERHRESKFTRYMDSIKIILFTAGVMGVGVGGMMLARKTQLLVNPKNSTVGLHQKMDSALFENPSLAIALAKMTLYHAISGVSTPFAAPMVSPPQLAEVAEQLENLVLELMQYQHDLSPADLWTILSTKSLLIVGGPNVDMTAGRPIDAASMKIKIVDPIVECLERDSKKLKDSLTRNGYRASDIVALVGGFQSLGYHLGSKVRFDVTDRKYVNASPTNDDLTFNKATTQPLVLGNEYFDTLVQHKWTREEGTEGKRHGLFGLFREKTVIASSPPKVYRCDDHRKAALRVKYVMPLQAPKTPMTETEAVEAAQKVENDADASTSGPSLCSQVSMQGIDVSLLDDVILSGWANRFADNEQLYFSEFGKLYAEILRKGYDRRVLNKQFAS